MSTNNNFDEGTSAQVLETVLGKMHTSYILWLVLGICQIVFGFWLITPLIIGIWNIVQTNKMKQNIDFFRKYPEGIVNFFASQENMCVLQLIINLVFGGIVGVIGSIYDLTICSYVKKHRSALE